MERMLLLAAFQHAPRGAGAFGLVGMLFGGAFFLFFLVLVVGTIAGLWGVFDKAGKPGWAALVPIYNLIVMLEIVNKPMWWVLLCLIPCVNFVVLILIAIELAKAFDKGTGFAIGMVLLPFVFYPILGFGDARYRG